MRTSRIVSGLVALVVAASGLVPGTSGRPAGAATTTLTHEATLTRTLGEVSSGGTGQAFSSPAVGDITGDGIPEVVVGMKDGVIRAYRSSDHAVVWSEDIGSQIQASPVLADLDGNRVSDVVVATMSGRLHWLKGTDGSTVRSFGEGPPLHCPAGVDCRPHGFFATPTVEDITGDGIPEIIAASWDHTVYAWKRTGALLFRTYLEDTLWSSPVVADIDHNGDAEIVLGGDIYPGNPLGVPEGGLVWVLNHTGSIYSGYPKHIPEQTVWSSPAVVDLNGDGDLDIVVGTGGYGPYGDTARSRRIYAFEAATRTTLSGWPQTLDGRDRNAPAVADVDGDGRPEVVVASEGGWVYAYEHTGVQKWRTCAVSVGCSDGKPTFGAPVVGDVDSDGEQEVVSALDQHVYVLDGSSGAVEDTYRMEAQGASPSTPALGTDGAGRALVAMQRGGTGTGSTNRLYLLSTGEAMCRADWPMFKRDARRSAFTSPTGEAWKPFDCGREFTAQQYQDFLGRSADASGLRYWSSRIENGSRTGASIIKEFMDSSEFGRVRSPVARLYKAITNLPPPDFATFADQAARFKQGTPLATIATEILAMPGLEDRAGASPSGKSRATFVTDTFRFVQGRLPTSAEQAAGEQALAGGMGRGPWVAERSEASSAKSRLVPEVYVTMTYTGMLGRVPGGDDLTGYDFWVRQVRGGSSITRLVSSFQSSSEYANRVT